MEAHGMKNKRGCASLKKASLSTCALRRFLMHSMTTPTAARATIIPATIIPTTIIPTTIIPVAIVLISMPYNPTETYPATTVSLEQRRMQRVPGSVDSGRFRTQCGVAHLCGNRDAGKRSDEQQSG
jgi:hypothetical protein